VSIRIAHSDGEQVQSKQSFPIVIDDKLWKEWQASDELQIVMGKLDTCVIDKQTLDKLQTWWEHLEEGCDGTH
jgi:hypothetical protein